MDSDTARGARYFPPFSPLTAQRTDMGNTMRIDMGNSFEFISPVLRGHVKGTLGNGATADVCEVGFEGPTKHVAVVSEVQIQPQERLQVVETFRARRMPR